MKREFCYKAQRRDFGDVVVDFQKAIVSKVSGLVAVKGVVVEPSVGLYFVFSDGVVFLGNVPSVSSPSTSPPTPNTPEIRTSTVTNKRRQCNKNILSPPENFGHKTKRIRHGVRKKTRKKSKINHYFR